MMALRFDWEAECSDCFSGETTASIFADYMRIDTDEAWIAISKEDAISLAKQILAAYVEVE